MDIKEFQEKLKDIVELAQLNQEVLTKEMVDRFFGEDLSSEQLQNVYDYLQTQKIQVVKEEKPDAAAPMSEEEEAYIRQYRKDMLTAPVLSQKEKEQLFSELWRGSDTARERLIEQYLPKVVDIVREVHQADFFAGDLIQEGNLSLVAALVNLTESEKPDQILCEAIRDGIRQSMEENQRSKWEDERLIDRVERLESAVRELSETGEKYSVEELSAFLDMSVEEIKDVLRLTGDDK
ncbi:MAG: RNA polymerase sigma factor region1.1 domain-containing protein [Lachnospiraceae bacterium]|nr:RNA polymerase sigma factor region1.1 domain-containing protein [Lachnospiraceae bacterium]